MHTLLTAPCLAAVDEYIPFFGMLIPITVFFVVLIIIVASQYFKNQSNKMWHETARIALEKGQPIPSAAPSDWEMAMGKKALEELQKRPGNQASWHSDVKAALILIAIAAGLYFSFHDLRGEGHHVPNLLFFVPGFIGLALLLNALIAYLTTKKNSETPSNPPAPKA